jgi:hypothetical protein
MEPQNPSRATVMCNLASFLTTKYDSNGDTAALMEAVQIGADALLLLSPNHRARDTTIHNLARSSQNKRMTQSSQHRLSSYTAKLSLFDHRATLDVVYR